MVESPEGQVSTRGLRVARGRPPAADRHLALWTLYIFFPNLLSSCPLFFVLVVNSCWLAPAHARLAQTSPQNFKHS
jgi:hypothetical protein